jgi:hypothetical protein
VAAFNNWGTAGVRLTADPAAQPGSPTGIAQGDILWLVIEDQGTDGTTGLPTVSGGTETWTQMPNSPQYSSGATRLFVYWARASQANPTMPSIGGGTNHTFAAVGRFTGGKTSGNPWNNSEYSGGSDAAANPTIPGVTHSTTDALAIVFVSSGFNGSSTTRFSAWTNADLGSFGEIFDEVNTIGGGGGFGAAAGTTSGTFGNTTVTEAFAGHGYIAVVMAPAPPPTTFSQPHFRIRTGDTVGLNTDSGWAANQDANSTIDAETVFRIRFEVAADATGSAKQFKLQYRRNGGGWGDVPIRTSSATHICDITLSSQYANDAATTSLLSATGTFEAGVGMEDDNLSPSITLISEYTEYEWALRIPISYGEANIQHGRNADGDTFEFRVVESGGAVFGGTYVNPTVTLNIPVGVLGGCYPESPCRMGPIADGNGNLYVFEEYADTSAWPVLLKSTDGGDSWSVCAGGGEPTWSGSKDLEGVDVQLVSHVLHIASTKGIDTAYHQYNTSSHGTPDTWAVKDERVVDTGAAPTDQKVSMVVRSDGTVIAAYRTNTANDIYYRIRSAAGSWGTPVELDTANSTDFTDVWMVVGESDVTYIFYYDYTNTTLYYKTLSAADSLSGRTSVATGLDTGSTYEKPMFGVIYYDDGGVEVITVGYKAADDTLYTRQLRDGALQTAQQVSTTTVRNHPAGASSQQPVADLVNTGTTLWCLYADAATSDVWKASNAAGAGWGSSTEVLDAVSADYVRGRIFTHSSGNGGATVYGFTWDDGAGLTGFVKYAEFSITTQQNASVTPTTVAAAAAVDTPTSAASASVTPSTVTATVEVPTPVVTATTDAIITPTTVTADVSIEVSPVVGNANAPPETVAALAAVPPPSASMGAPVTPTTVAGSTTVPTPTFSASVAITPDTVAVAAAVPTPTFSASVAITPGTVDASATVPSPTTGAGPGITPTTVDGAVSVPTPTVTTGGSDAPITFLDEATGLTLTVVSQTQIDLSWNAVSGASTYRITRNGAVVEPANPDTTYSDTVSPNVAYHYTVKAVP